MCEIQQMVGFQKEIKGGIVFYRQHTIFYVAGQTGLFHNLKDNTQRFISMIEKNKFTAMTLGAKDMLALSTKGRPAKIIVYNLKSTKKYLLSNPKSFHSSEYVHVSFSEDNEYLAAQGGSASWTFVIWFLEKRSVLASFSPLRTESGMKVFKFAFHPKDYTSIVVVGRYFLRLYQILHGNRIHEDAFHEQERSNITFHSVTWLQESNKFAVGTSDGMVLIFQGKQMFQQVSIEKKLADVPRIYNEIDNKEDKNITCVLSTKAGMICSYGGNSVLCLHRNVDKKDFAIVKSIHIPKQTECNVEGSTIVQVVLNSNEDMLVASTDDGQILVFSFTVPGLLGCIGYEATFDVILDQQHKTRVICADTAINRAVHVTCSSSTLILWDYAKRKLLLWKKFESEIQSVSIHPLGTNLLIGFSDSAKLYNILHNKIEEVQHFNTKSSSQVRFAEGGHLMAIVNEECVELYSSLSFEKYAEFAGLKGEIKYLTWKDCDNRLLSSDEMGHIYEWDVCLKTVAWKYSSSVVVFANIAINNSSLYAATTDCKIWLFNKYEKNAEIGTPANVTFLLATEKLLLAGNEYGSVLGYELSLNQNALFETSCHQGTIVNMSLKEGGGLLLVTGEDSAISMWKVNAKKKPILTLDEVLIERDVLEANDILIRELERELQEQTAIAHRKSEQQFQAQEAEKSELMHQYEDIQNQLKEKIIMLSENKYNLQVELEEDHLSKLTVLTNERDENYADFQTKMSKEEEHFKSLAEERVKKIEYCEWQLFNLKEEIKASNESVRKIKEKNEIRLRDIENLLKKELDARQEIMRKNEEFYRHLEEEAETRSEETKFTFASALQDVRVQNQRMMTEVDNISAELYYEKECSLSLDAEFGKKKRMYDDLKKITKHIKSRISQMNQEIERKESVLEDKVAMIKVLEDDATELKHMSSEANLKLEECKKTLEEKTQVLAKLKEELERLENDYREVYKNLKEQQREQEKINEKMKSTEKSIGDSTQKLLKAQLLLERYWKEFDDETKGVDNPMLLRWALLRLFDKRVLRGRLREEEVFVGDTDPYMKFCRQRDNYESIINTVLNRKQEIQASFRATYVKLAKENSDWTAFAEELLLDLQQKQARIQTLETAVELKAQDFPKDPPETQRRFHKIYDSLKSVQIQEDEEIQKRMDLIEIQGKELQRLHGLIVVEEKGKILRKMGR